MLTSRFSAALEAVAPKARAVIAGTMITAAAVVAPAPASAQAATVPECSMMDVQNGVPGCEPILPYGGNQGVLEPRATGGEAARIVLNLTDNTLIWLDAKGAPTWAPRPGAIKGNVPVSVVGSLEARYLNNPRATVARMAEPTRILLSRNGNVLDEALVVMVRGAPGDPVGFPNYKPSPEVSRIINGPPPRLRDHGTFVGQANGHTSSTHEQYDPYNQSVTEELRRLPGETVKETARSSAHTVASQVRWAIESAISQKVAGILR